MIDFSALATTERLLVVSDFDGTLAGLGPSAMEVPVHGPSLDALEWLARLPQTQAAVLSGRDLAALRQVSRMGPPVVLAGSHGAETDGEEQTGPSDSQLMTLEEVSVILEELAAPVEGAFVEHKPFHRVLHAIRATDKEAAAGALEQAMKIRIPGAHVKPGKFIVEVGVTHMTKGTWLRQAARAFNATAVVFLGDDTTDEDGFAVLGENDLSVKVGPGDTAARVRVADITSVGALLQDLARVRAASLPSPPYETHSSAGF